MPGFFVGDAGGTAPPSGLPAISPTRGEIDVTPAFANHERCRMGGAAKLPISPLVGEMPGRVEGGANDRCPRD
ncbi:MAG: propionyl-coenzyme A carboxylase alpha polypeptide [Mesorhizobium sp.]|nr:MAG: propionyl-coenzyme A carboxylase alpha polypeptide [Mesorhizobium sp.]